MQRNLMLARVVVLPFLILAGACTHTVAPTYLITRRYEEPVDVGRGTTVRLEVVQFKADSLQVGVTQDIYREPIVLPRPSQDIVRDAFVAGLSRAGYIVTEDADRTMQVKIRDFSVNWAQSFGGMAVTSVSVKVEVLERDQLLGGREFAESARDSLSLGQSNEVLATTALSVVMSWVVEGAVRDEYLASLLED